MRRLYIISHEEDTPNVNVRIMKMYLGLLALAFEELLAHFAMAARIRSAREATSGALWCVLAPATPALNTGILKQKEQPHFLLKWLECVESCLQLCVRYPPKAVSHVQTMSCCVTLF